jgi:hypothetical protein
MSVMMSAPLQGWSGVAKHLPGRSARQCRERWNNYLSPSVRLDPWTDAEDRLLIDRVNELNFSWSLIAQSFNGRSDNDIKNRWHSHLKYVTVRDGDKYVLAACVADSPYPDRKRRQRAKVCPKQNAMRLLEQQRAAATLQAMASLAQQETQPAAAPKQDFWHRLLLEEGMDDQFTFTFL